jgi:hypothetical protein
MQCKTNGNRRKTKVIMRDMQARLIRETSLIPLVGLTVLAVTVTELGRRVIGEASAALVELPHLDMLLIAVAVMTSFIVGAVLYVAFRFTHRVAGPSYRLIESLKRVQRGDVDFQIRLRKGDFLTEVADEFNKTLEALQQRRNGNEGAHGDSAAVEDPEASEADVVTANYDAGN